MKGSLCHFENMSKIIREILRQDIKLKLVLVVRDVHRESISQCQVRQWQHRERRARRPLVHIPSLKPSIVLMAGHR